MKKKVIIKPRSVVPPKADSVVQKADSVVQKAATAVDVDEFIVCGGTGRKTSRLEVEIPRALCARVVTGCAREGKDIKDVVRELLEQRFPEGEGRTP